VCYDFWWQVVHTESPPVEDITLETHVVIEVKEAGIIHHGNTLELYGLLYMRHPVHERCRQRRVPSRRVYCPRRRKFHHMVFEEKFLTSLIICCAHDGILGPHVHRQFHMQFDSIKHGMLFTILVSNSKGRL
jgi:hypothetical protein